MSDHCLDLMQQFYDTGEPRYAGEFFTYHFDFIYRIAIYYTRNRHDAEDVCQQIFLDILNKNSKCSAVVEGKPEKIKSWLAIVCVNRSRLFLRQKKNMEKRNQKAQGKQKLNDKETFSDELSLQLDDALSALPLKYKIPILMRYKEDLSFAEISEILNKKQATIRMRISRGLSSLRERLGVVKTSITLIALIKLIQSVEVEASSKGALEKCLTLNSSSASHTTTSSSFSMMKILFIPIVLIGSFIIYSSDLYSKFAPQNQSELNGSELHASGKRSWDFSIDDGKDIQINKGNWFHDKTEKAMVVKNQFEGILPIIYQKPTLITVTGTVLPSSKTNKHGIFLGAGRTSLFDKKAEIVYQSPDPNIYNFVGSNYISQFYVLDEKIITFLYLGKANYISAIDWQNQEITGLDSLGVTCKTFKFEKIVCADIKESDLKALRLELKNQIKSQGVLERLNSWLNDLP